MGAKKVKTSIRKTQITEAALDTIARDGIKGLTIAAIARQAGMTDSNVYRHFRDKRELILAIISQFSLSLENIIQDSRQFQSVPLEQLKTIFFKHMAFLEAHQAIPRIFLSEEMYSDDRELINKMRDVMKRYLNEIREILRIGKETKVFEPYVDEEAAAAVFLGLIQSTALQWFVMEHSFSIQDRSQKIWDIYLNGTLQRL